MSTLMNVFVKMPSGKFIHLNLNNSLTVASFKKMFCSKIDFPTTDNLYFSFDSKKLWNTHTLETYNISDGSMLSVYFHRPNDSDE